MGLDLNQLALQVFASVMLFAGIYLLVRYGYAPGLRWFRSQETRYENVLCRQLMMDINPRLAVIANLVMMFFVFVILWLLAGFFIALLLGSLTLLIPYFFPF